MDGTAGLDDGALYRCSSHRLGRPSRSSWVRGISKKCWASFSRTLWGKDSHIEFIGWLRSCWTPKMGVNQKHQTYETRFNVKLMCNSCRTHFKLKWNSWITGERMKIATLILLKQRTCSILHWWNIMEPWEESVETARTPNRLSSTHWMPSSQDDRYMSRYIWTTRNYDKQICIIYLQQSAAICSYRQFMYLLLYGPLLYCAGCIVDIFLLPKNLPVLIVSLVLLALLVQVSKRSLVSLTFDSNNCSLSSDSLRVDSWCG